MESVFFKQGPRGAGSCGASAKVYSNFQGDNTKLYFQGRVIMGTIATATAVDMLSVPVCSLTIRKDDNHNESY